VYRPALHIRLSANNFYETGNANVRETENALESVIANGNATANETENETETVSATVLSTNGILNASKSNRIVLVCPGLFICGNENL
jgi:hypothetical protein